MPESQIAPATVEPYALEALLDWPREALPELEPARLSITASHTLAQFFERLEVDEARLVLRKLSPEQAADALVEMDQEAAADVLGAMREARALSLLDAFEADDAADIVAELEAGVRQRLLGKLEGDSRHQIERLLEYPPETAGGIMNPAFDTLHAAMSIDAAIARIRQFADQHEDLHYVYVVDQDGVLAGAVSLRKLIQARPSQCVRDVMRGQLRGVVRPEEDQEAVAQLMAAYNLPDIAVVDEAGRLLGIITHDDVLDVIQAEATEDIQRLAGAGGDESLTDDVGYSIRQRLPWLMINLVTAFGAAWVISLYEAEIARLPLLAAFMPIVAAIGGNSGQQALAVAIRSLAMGEVQDVDRATIIAKQLFVGLSNGVLVGLVAALTAALVSQNAAFGLVILLAMAGNTALAGICGAFIPLLLQQLKFDPAASSSIFLTAITDTGGFLIFLSLGAWLLL